MIGQKIDVKQCQDARGVLIAVNEVPFNAKRLFFISEVVKGAVRGNHFSKTSAFLYVAVKGGCIVDIDDGFHSEKHVLQNGDGLIIPKIVWMKLYDFQEDTVMAVLADTEYKPDDYCSDYNEFMRIVRDKNV